MIKSWSEKGKDIRWAIKINKSITHRHKFNEEALEIWKKFEDAFRTMDTLIDFYLFQLPLLITPNLASRIAAFAEETALQQRFALEFRNKDWFQEKWYEWAEEKEITLVSVDAPELPRKIYAINDVVYLRMHGRRKWYRHKYSTKELEEIEAKICKAEPEKAYVFFNNNHNMLKDARKLQELMEEKKRTGKKIGKKGLK